MGLMELIGQLMNPNPGPTPPGATPPYMPTSAGAQTPGPAPATGVANPVTPMMPGVPKPQGNVQPNMGPPKSLAGDLGLGPDQLQGPPRAQGSELLEPVLPNQISVPQREKAETWVDMPWYKDKDRLGMMLAMAGNGFSGMSMRPNRGIQQMNNALFAKGAENIKQNKTMKYLAENNPEMFKVMAKLPPDQRGDYMKLAMQSKFKGLSGENSTADIRNFEYFNSLDTAQQRQFLGLKRGDEMIKGTDGSVQVRRADGTVETLITAEQALRGTSQMKDAEAEGGANNQDFKTAYRAARYADDNIASMVRQIERLEQFPDRGGIFQPLTQMTNEILAEFGSQEALDKATAEQLNESDNIRRTMQWFQDSGLGARGLDTPAEFMNWLKMNGGNLSMTNEASIAFLKRAIQDQVRNVGRYNEMLDDPVYGTVNNRDSYVPFSVTDPYAIPVDPDGWGIE